jgi:hypothetical protein
VRGRHHFGTRAKIKLPIRLAIGCRLHKVAHASLCSSPLLLPSTHTATTAPASALAFSRRGQEHGQPSEIRPNPRLPRYMDTTAHVPEPVATAKAMPLPTQLGSRTTDPAALKDLTDGELFYIIKNGKGRCP